MSKEIIDELKLIGQYFDASNLDVYEQKHHIRFTSIIKDRIDFYINKSDKKQLTLSDVVSTYHCESYDFKRQGRRCAKQCDSCEWMEKKQ